MNDVKPNTITLKQKFAVGNRLAQVLTEQSDGLWRYADGYDDETIAKEFGITKLHVMSVRKRAFGKLFVIGVVPGGASEPSANLKRRVRALEEWATQMDPDWAKANLVKL